MMATPVLVPNRQRERAFYTTVALLAALIVFVGFARTYYLKEFFGIRPLPLLVHFHGLIFTAWIVLFVVQTRLVATRRIKLHRTLGVAGGALATLMVVVGFATAIGAAKHGAAVTAGPPGVPPLVFLVVPFMDIVMFVVLAGAGFVWRRRSDIHKRMMLLATISILPPAVARMLITLHTPLNPLLFFGIPDVVLLGCIAYDCTTRRKLNPAYLWGGLILLASQPLRLMLGDTHAWLVFAQWLVK
jgi:hypothetical protein